MGERLSPFDQQVTFIYVADLDRSARFYGELLELPLALDQGACRIFAVTKTAYIGICTCRDEPAPNGVIITLVVPDVEGWSARLMAAGAEVETPARYNEAFKITQCFVRDPDGHLIEIQRFHDPAWPASETALSQPI
jgi:catechol 2,3-dioxygenase-like lactoylglutathione lyase family enzyme